MKRVLAVLVCLVLICGFAGCGKTVSAEETCRAHVEAALIGDFDTAARYAALSTAEYYTAFLDYYEEQGRNEGSAYLDLAYLFYTYPDIPTSIADFERLVREWQPNGYAQGFGEGYRFGEITVTDTEVSQEAIRQRTVRMDNLFGVLDSLPIEEYEQFQVTVVATDQSGVETEASITLELGLIDGEWRVLQDPLRTAVIVLNSTFPSPEE